jgi:hypothetical protein
MYVCMGIGVPNSWVRAYMLCTSFSTHYLDMYIHVGAESISRYVCKCAYMRAWSMIRCMHACIHLYTYTLVNICWYVHTCGRGIILAVCMHVCMYICMCVCVYAYMCTWSYSMPACLHACMHKCMHTPIHKYTHMHVRTYINTYLCAGHARLPTYTHIYMHTFCTYPPTSVKGIPYTRIHTYILAHTHIPL